MLPQLLGHLLDNWQSLPLVTPRPKELSFSVQATGVGKLCCYLFPDDATEPLFVAKMRRSPAENEWLSREYDLIQHLRRNGSEFVRATIPGPLAQLEVAGYLVVLEPYLQGKAMDGLIASKKGQDEGLLAGCLDRAIGWLLKCQLETPLQMARLTEEQVERHFLMPIARLRSTARLTDAESAYLDRLTARIRRIARLPLPLVFKHGDFQPGNILLQGEALQVIDWEFGRALALPLLDLFGFLLRTHARRLGLEEMDGFLEDYLANFASVFFDGGEFAGYTDTYVARGLSSLEIDNAWAPVLFAMFLITEANKYEALLRRRAETGYLYLMRDRAGLVSGSFSDQLARQKNVWLLGQLAENEDGLAFPGSGTGEVKGEESTMIKTSEAAEGRQVRAAVTVMEPSVQ